MVDFNYICLPSRGNVYRACHCAVFRSLRPAHPGSTVSGRIHSILKSWRIRVSILSDHGWSCAQGKDFQYIRNCPPYGIQVIDENPAARRCCRRRICPWCYSKTVVATAYEAVEQTLYQGERRPDRGLWLHAIQRRWSWSLEDVTVKDVFDGADSQRRADTGGDGVIGSFTLARVQPAKDNCIELVRSTILVVKDGELPGLAEGGRTKSLKKVKKASMADLVGWACHYPAGVMYGDPQLTVEILDEAKRRRFRSHFRTGALHWGGVEQGA